VRAGFQIDIPKGANCCSKGNEPLEPGAQYHSVLSDGEGEETLRHDYCVACWTALEQAPEGHTHWIGKVPAKKEKREPLNRDDQAFELLRCALDSAEPEAKSEAFVLALYLARRRILAMRKEKASDEGSLQLYEVMASGEMLAVPRIDLSHLQVEAIQKAIAKKMKGPPPETEQQNETDEQQRVTQESEATV